MADALEQQMLPVATGALVERVRLPSAAASEATALISLIERLASDPSVDVERVERMYAMYERAAERSARQAYDLAFAEMQAEMPEIDKRGKIIIRDKQDREAIIQSTPYALWDDTNKLIKPILAKYGFGLSFRIIQTEARLTTRAVLSHIGGHREETEFSSPIDSTGSKNNVQGWGSAFSYGKRYTGTAILNITTKGEDDDGKKAGAGETITDEQAKLIKEAIEETGGDIPRFCAYYKLEKVSDLPASKFSGAMATIQKAAQMRGRQ